MSDLPSLSIQTIDRTVSSGSTMSKFYDLQNQTLECKTAAQPLAKFYFAQLEASAILEDEMSAVETIGRNPMLNEKLRLHAVSLQSLEKTCPCNILSPMRQARSRADARIVSPATRRRRAERARARPDRPGRRAISCGFYAVLAETTGLADETAAST